MEDDGEHLKSLGDQDDQCDQDDQDDQGDQDQDQEGFKGFSVQFGAVCLHKVEQAQS